MATRISCSIIIVSRVHRTNRLFVPHSYLVLLDLIVAKTAVLVVLTARICCKTLCLQNNNSHHQQSDDVSLYSYLDELLRLTEPAEGGSHSLVEHDICHGENQSTG